MMIVNNAKNPTDCPESVKFVDGNADVGAFPAARTSVVGASGRPAHAPTT